MNYMLEQPTARFMLENWTKAQKKWYKEIPFRHLKKRQIFLLVPKILCSLNSLPCNLSLLYSLLYFVEIF